MNNSKVIFRQAEPDDLNAALELMRQYYSQEGYAVQNESASAALRDFILSQPQHGRIWLIEENHTALGYVILTLGFSLEYLGRDAFIDELYVVPEARGRGLGAQAIQLAESAAQELGVRALHLEVEKSKRTALELYRRRGFEDHDRFLMTKTLDAEAARTTSAPLLYTTFAALWPLFSPPEDYVEEVETFRRRFLRHGVRDGASVLHLGSGGGSVDYNLKQHYHVVGVELSPDMISQAQRINPEVEYVQGDIRNVRLGRSFDAVLVHDAISYMTSVRELEAVYETAAQHLLPGGVMVALPEEVRERANLEPSAETRTTGDVTLTVMETHFDADPNDNSQEAVYVFLVRDRNGVRVVLDRHTTGIFELSEFLGAMERSGFSAKAERWELSEWGDQPEMPLITAIRL
jgi:ribosomal protein S18 acetylase RimI-like enzyme